MDTVIDRIELLECVLEDPKDKRTLENEVSASRSTIDRALRQLEVMDLVEYCSDGYRITPVGELVTRECTDVLETTAVALDFGEFLRWMPLSEFDLGVERLADAELLVPDPNNPYAMVDRHVRVLKEMERGRGMLPLTGLHAAEAAHESIVENGAEGELVVESGVAEIMLSDPAFEDLTAEALQTGRFDLFVYDGTIPYFVGVFDDEIVQIGVDEDGEPRALVQTDRDDVRSWAHETIDEYKRQATALPQVAAQEPPTSVVGE